MDNHGLLSLNERQRKCPGFASLISSKIISDRTDLKKGHDKAPWEKRKGQYQAKE